MNGEGFDIQDAGLKNKRYDVSFSKFVRPEDKSVTVQGYFLLFLKFKTEGKLLDGVAQEVTREVAYFDAENRKLEKFSRQYETTGELFKKYPDGSVDVDMHLGGGKLPPGAVRRVEKVSFVTYAYSAYGIGDVNYFMRLADLKKAVFQKSPALQYTLTFDFTEAGSGKVKYTLKHTAADIDTGDSVNVTK